MELFFKALDKEPRWQHDKQMIHYHKFMLNVHQFMHTSKQKHGNDHHPIDAVVQHILQSGRLLCLDEFQVTDVADAMILKELFGKLWKKDCILVTTSNRPPQDLYLNGLQRDRFLPFVDLLEDRCNVVSLVESETDYRMVISAMDKNENDDDEISDHSKDNDKSEELISTDSLPPTPKRHQVYFCGQDQQEVLQKHFYEKAKGAPTNPSTLETQGRTVQIPMACTSKSICMFSFEDICQKALGAADYLVIGQNFSTLYVYGIPTMTVNEINWLRRFITLVDSMYECKVRLVLQTTANSVEEIFTVEDKESYQQDEVFAFDRTRSRLGEMSSRQYLASPWIGSGSTTNKNQKLILEPSIADQWFRLVGGKESLPKSSDQDCVLFDNLDANSDGVLDRDEVNALFIDAFGYEPVDLVLDELIASVDTDRNGVIDREEFRALLAAIRKYHRKRGKKHTSSTNLTQSSKHGNHGQRKFSSFSLMQFSNQQERHGRSYSSSTRSMQSLSSYSEGAGESGNDERSTVAVIGAGAVGGYYGARLWESKKYDIKFHMRGEHYEVSTRDGLRVESIDGDIFIPPAELNAFTNPEDVGAVDWIIVSIKSSFLGDIPNLIRSLIDSNKSRILVIMNGLIEEDLITLLEDEIGKEFCAALYGGMALICSNRIGPGRINHSYAGLLSGGVALSSESFTEDENQQAFRDLWAPTSIDIAYEPSLLGGRWRKCLWNLPFNGISVAMNGITVDKIVNDPGLRQLAHNIMDETVEAANADLAAHGFDKEYFLDEEDKKKMMDLSDNMGPYRTSTMIDFVEGRALETHYLFTKPVERAQSLGVVSSIILSKPIGLPL